MRQLYTEFSKHLNKEHILEEYPRPMLVRNSWYNLNGLWDYAVTGPKDPPRMPERPDGKILVPFSPECALSGVKKKILPEHILWYRRKLPSVRLQSGERLILHFGAVDQHAWVSINGRYAGEHHGGYLPFSLDITDLYRAEEARESGADAGTPIPSETQADCETETCHTLTVMVIDLTDTSYHSRGKQKLKPSGMYYTAQSGIWQTVWMEVVPENHIRRVVFRPDYDGRRIRIRLTASSNTPVRYTIFRPRLFRETDVCASDDAFSASETLTEGSAIANRPFSAVLSEFRPWTPEEPYLYPVVFQCGGDLVRSYFAMRVCGLEKDSGGVPRLCLNHRPYFQTGLLDQGYFPESLYTPPCDRALVSDILSARSLGFNMLRVHAKIEPDRFYSHCDRLGMLVWQDMVNGGNSYHDWYVTYVTTALNRFHIKLPDWPRFLLSRQHKAGREEFVSEVRETVRTLESHPSIVVWVPFNEGWGQFDTRKICALIKKTDPSRLVDHASGWYDRGAGDFQSIHYYFFRYNFKPEKKRAMALTEYGGYSWPVPGHSTLNAEYGYRKYKSSKELTDAFKRLIRTILLPSVREGLTASVYTQLTDVEGETNGLYTYDRAVCKMDPDVIRECNRLLKTTMAEAAQSPDPAVKP